MCTEGQQLSKTEEIVKGLRPIDDTLFRKMFNGNIPLTQLVLRIFLDKPDLVVENVNTQFDLKKLMGARSLILDAYATDSEGKKYNIEAEKSENRAEPNRARYHLSALDVENSKTCTDFDQLPTTYILFITEKDIFGADKPIYHVERKIIETGEDFKDGEHIIYLNASYKDDSTNLGKLLHDFMCSDPKDMIIPEISKSANEWKNTKKGLSIMCKAVEDYANAKIIEIALNLLKAGQTVTFTSSMTKLAIDFVKQLAIDNNIAYVM
ncbi:MAG: PD-(D/E)XK nuclease family transposase [Firmicutes bacterium]|nr:PD-(D/E)XK nuclease family transposase [Bacillota bacterium]